MTGTISDWDPLAGRSDQVIPGSGFFSNLSKFGTGHLILPNANTYRWDRRGGGWITVRHNNALGTKHSEPGARPTGPPRPFPPRRPLPAAHRRHAAHRPQQLRPHRPGHDHPFDLIDEAGRCKNIEGNNKLTGVSTPVRRHRRDRRRAGSRPGPGRSRAKHPGYLQNFGTTTSGPNKLGSHRLTIQGSRQLHRRRDRRRGRPPRPARHRARRQHRHRHGPGRGCSRTGQQRHRPDRRRGWAAIWGETLRPERYRQRALRRSPLTVLRATRPRPGRSTTRWSRPTTSAQADLALPGHSSRWGRTSRLILAGPINDANNPSASGSDQRR